jgi:hypothetical protein
MLGTLSEKFIHVDASNLSSDLALAAFEVVGILDSLNITWLSAVISLLSEVRHRVNSVTIEVNFHVLATVALLHASFHSSDQVLDMDLLLASELLQEEALVDVVNVEFGENLSQYG